MELLDDVCRSGRASVARPELWQLHVAVHQRRDATARAALVEEYRPNAIALARRLHRDGEPLEDLVQIALEALLLAIDRFDPAREMPFLAFATPTIVGTIKRHYRDHGWSMRVPRRVHELASPVRDAVEMLHHDLGRSPTPAEVADLLGVTTVEVREAMAATTARRMRSLDVPEDDRPLDPGTLELGYGRLEDHDALRRAIDDLEPQQQRVLALYYEEGLTQSAIGERLGCSQMHVSRIIRGAIKKLMMEASPAEHPGRRAPLRLHPPGSALRRPLQIHAHDDLGPLLGAGAELETARGL